MTNPVEGTLEIRIIFSLFPLYIVDVGRQFCPYSKANAYCLNDREGEIHKVLTIGQLT